MCEFLLGAMTEGLGSPSGDGRRWVVGVGLAPGKKRKGKDGGVGGRSMHARVEDWGSLISVP